MAKTRFYVIWRGVVSRCTNKNYFKYKNYGGRGIRVCKRWESFENFRDDIYTSYLEHIKQFGESQTSIDRINNDGNYEPLNCRWATYRVQNRNTKQNHWIEFNGQRMVLTDWAKKLEIKPTTLLKRIIKWPLERALTEPINKNCQRFNK